MSVGEFLRICLSEMKGCRRDMLDTLTHTNVHTDTHTYAIGKARVSGVSQGRLRLRALMDCSYGAYVPWPHLCACQRVCCMAGRWKWQHWEWFCHLSLKRKVRCAMLVIHQDIDSSDGILEKGERWKCKKKRHQNYLLANLYNDEADSNSNEHPSHKVSPCSFVSYLNQDTSLYMYTSD